MMFDLTSKLTGVSESCEKNDFIKKTSELRNQLTEEKNQLEEKLDELKKEKAALYASGLSVKDEKILSIAASEKKVLKKMQGVREKIEVLGVSAKVFDLTPSALDLFTVTQPQNLINAWAKNLSDASVTRENWYNVLDENTIHNTIASSDLKDGEVLNIIENMRSQAK